MIKISDIRKIYRTSDVETTALNEINIEIERGELVAITGASGSGKSTLLNILGLIDKPDSGAYYFNNQLMSGMSEKQRAIIRKENIGFVFQSFNLINELTIFENVELPLLYTKINNTDRRQRVLTLLEHMNLSHRKDHYPQQLSGGQQQRVAVARAICNNPKIVLADEPTGNLDTKNGDEVMKQLLLLNEQGTTVVIVTHSQYYEQFCNRTIRLLDGRIVTEHVKGAFNV